MQILIVEDERNLALALGQIMAEAGYFADTAHNGEDGLRYGMCGLYDVIILDIMLPGKNGFEVVKELRDRQISTPVIMLTARDDVKDKISGLDTGRTAGANPCIGAEAGRAASGRADFFRFSTEPLFP